MKRSVKLTLGTAAGLVFVACMPDFDKLTAGEEQPTAGTAGTSTNGGDSSGGTGGTGGTGVNAGSAGQSSGGEPSGGGQGGDDGGAGMAGSGNGECVTEFPGDVKFSFDSAGTAFSGVDFYPEDSTGKGRVGTGEPNPCEGPVASTSFDYNATEGHSCPGSLQVTIPFTAYSSPNQVSVAINFAPADWTEYSLVHAWVKVLAPAIDEPNTSTLNYLAQLQFAVASSSAGPGTNNYAGYTSSTKPLSDFADREWHHVQLGLVPGNSYYPDAVLNVSVQIQSVGAKPLGGPDAPPTTVVLIDDIWVE